MNLTYMHHEHYDGTGYPQGLAGEDISIGAHIIQLSDTYDAMTTQRAYREAMPTHIAFDILIEESGHQFHPKVVEITLRVLRYCKLHTLRLIHQNCDIGIDATYLKIKNKLCNNPYQSLA